MLKGSFFPKLNVNSVLSLTFIILSIDYEDEGQRDDNIKPGLLPEGDILNLLTIAGISGHI